METFDLNTAPLMVNSARLTKVRLLPFAPHSNETEETQL